MTKKAISLAEFNELSLAMQLDILQKNGVHVGKRTINSQRVILYQLYTFYVEVYFIEYRKKVERLITTDNTDILQPYLEQIRIRDLDQGKE